jgi:hypothetical protein
MTKTRTVSMRALSGVQLPAVSGPLDMFAKTNVQARRKVYRLLLIASWPPAGGGRPALNETGGSAAVGQHGESARSEVRAASG